MSNRDAAEWVIRMRRSLADGGDPQEWEQEPESLPRTFAECQAALDGQPPHPSLMAQIFNVATGEEVNWPIRD
jgi:hypothetical protein